MTGVGGASLDWDRRRRVTPAQTKSQETWPEAEPWGRRLPLVRAVVERRQASAPCKARAASQDAADTDQRLSAFRFLFAFVIASSAPAERPTLLDETIQS